MPLAKRRGDGQTWNCEIGGTGNKKNGGTLATGWGHQELNLKPRSEDRSATSTPKKRTLIYHSIAFVETYGKKIFKNVSSL
jgi:hypothetical protein